MSDDRSTGTGNWARAQRAAYCDTVAALGPDQPTLCAGWTTRDLTAHLIVRERRLDAAPGILLRPLAGHTAAVQASVARRPFDDLVAQVRNPPLWTLAAIGPLDRMINTVEFFIHTEDVRRAQAQWEPRPLAPGLAAALWTRMRSQGRFALRRFPARVLLDSPGYGQAPAGTGAPGTAEVRISGDPGELALFLTGRQDAAQVDVSGPEELVARLRGARLGL